MITRVGNTGRATNDHLHLEVQPSPVDAVRVIVDPEQRFPPHVTNPERWVEREMTVAAGQLAWVEFRP